MQIAKCLWFVLGNGEEMLSSPAQFVMFGQKNSKVRARLVP